MYDTNGLTLNDLYPYGEQHGDATKTKADLPEAPLLELINNLIGLGSHGLTATTYIVSCIHSYTLGMVCSWYSTWFWHVL